MFGDALSRLATAAALAAPSAAVGILRCLSILLVAMAMSKIVRSARAAHCLLAVGLLSLPMVLSLSFTPGIELAILPSPAPAAPALSAAMARTYQTVLPVFPGIADIDGSAVNPGADTRVDPLAAVTLIGLLAWLTGWGIVTIRQCAGHLAVAAMTRSAGQAPSPEVRALVDRGQERFGIVRPVRIAIHDGSYVPFTRGTLRPVICLPTRLLELAPQRIKLIILHELAHVRRLDTLVATAARFACGVLWFLPPVWIALHWLERTRESACDDAVLAIAPDASEYATTLVLTARAARMPAPSAVTSGSAPLESRIRNILRSRSGKEHVMKPSHRAMIAASVIALATTALLRCAPSGSEAATADMNAASSGTVEPLPRMAWPLEDGRGYVTTKFGPFVHPFTGKSAMHPGLDIAWAEGLSVLAAADGIVEKIGVDDASGVFLILKHGTSFFTSYTHLEGTTVFIGDSVEQGQVIGHLGNTGLTTGPHLHFEIRRGSDPVDPLAHLTDVPASALQGFSAP